MQRGVRRIGALLLAIALVFLTEMQIAAAPQIVYRHASSTGKKRVALTFDDGPHPRYTREILEILAEYGVPATFFVIGVNAETYPELIKREVAEGHEIGNHTYNHYHLSKLSAEAFEKDMQKCAQTVNRIIGREPILFRPPEGACSQHSKDFCEKNGYPIIMWSVDTRDWAHTPIDEIVENVKKNTKDGSIILMHDFIGKNSPTPVALRRIIPMLQESGFEFVTVSQLLLG